MTTTEEQIKQEVARELARKAGVSGQSPILEPYLAQIDEAITNAINNHAYKWVEDKENEKYVQILVHPDIADLKIATSHLLRTSNLTVEMTRNEWWKLRHILRKRRAMHNKDDNIKNLLELIETTLHNALFGGAELGKQQNYITKLMGAEKKITVGSGSDRRKGWLRIK